MMKLLASLVSASFALLVFLFPAGLPAADDDVTAEARKFEGVWYSHEVVINGKQQSGENPADEHIFAGNKWTQKFNGQVVAEGTFTVHQRKPYWVIDSEYTSPDKGKHWHAIYRFDGDTLQWLGENTPPRAPAFNDEEYQKLPKTFETKPGDRQFMRTLKRMKDK